MADGKEELEGHWPWWKEELERHWPWWEEELEGHWPWWEEELEGHWPWSKDAANRCCPDGQYEGLNALCENCPAGKYLTWIQCRSSEQNRCRNCGKGKVRENRSKSRHSDSLF